MPDAAAPDAAPDAAAPDAAAQDRAFVARHCAALPGAELTHPFGDDHDCWKVGGKIFAIATDPLPAGGAVVPAGQAGGVSVKTDHIETARLLIETGRATRAPYLHASWARIPFGAVTGDELRERLSTSYALIRASLPRKFRDGLG